MEGQQMEGQFEYVKDEMTRMLLQDAWKAITVTEGWEFIKNYKGSLSYCVEPKMKQINKKMYTGHSGTSYSYTMNVMQLISQEGETYFEKNYR